MPLDRFLIAPYDKDSGLHTDVKPWLIPDKAFTTLSNAYVFRGRVRKRFGSRWMGDNQQQSRFRINIGTTNNVGSIDVFVPRSGGVPIATPAIGQMFSIGNELLTVNALGNPATLLDTGVSAVHTFDTTTGEVIIVGAAPNTTLYYYPALPVMGLITFEVQTVGNDPVIGFDTRFAYQYLATGWERLNLEITPGSSFWTGSNSQFFWGASYNGANAFDYVLFVTNFNQNEPLHMRTLSGPATLVNPLTWNTFAPVVSVFVAGPPLVTSIVLYSALIIVPFKNRLCVFNTWEFESSDNVNFRLNNYPFRMRYSAIGSALDPLAFRQDIQGRGSGIDCPTNEAIITVEFVKDRLIVFLERSTWEIVYTGNQIYPFAWQQINTELGVESTFSIVPFDKVALGVGNVGVMACNGANVERIDTAIPQEVFQIHNLDAGVERVYGIRDYYVEMVYWTFPDPTASTDFPYPNRVLVFNYNTGTWAFNFDSITAFGYFQPQTGITWDSTQVTWDMPVSWDSGTLQALFRQVIGGNQEGWTFIIDADTPTNAAVIQITDLTFSNDGSGIITITAIDHNYNSTEFVYLADIVGTLDALTLNNKIFKIETIIDRNNFTIILNPPGDPASVYNGGGVIRLVSNIDIQTKEYNFYVDTDQNCYVSKIDFQVDRTDTGAVTVDYFISSNPESMVSASLPVIGTGSNLGTNVLETSPYALYPFEQGQTRLLHPVYIQADGEFIQLQITMSDDQMLTVIPVLNDEMAIVGYTGPSFEDFQMHSMCIYATPSTSRMQ